MTGQAAPAAAPVPPRRRWLGRAARVALGLTLGVGMLAGLALGVMAWRLSHGPVEITWAEDRLRAGFTVGGGTLRGRSASLAWDGWRGGVSALPAIRIEEARFEAAGARAEATAVLVHLALPALLRGELAPTLLELQSPRLTLTGIGEGETAEGLPDMAGVRPWLAAPDESRRHFALRGLRVMDGQIIIAGVPGRPTLVFDGIVLLARRGATGLYAEGEAALRLPGTEIPLRIDGSGGDGGSELRAQASGIRPATLAGLVPALAPLAGLDTTLTVEATLSLDAALAPRRAGLTLTAAPGSYAWPAGSIGFQRATARAELHTHGLDVTAAELVLAGGGVLQARGRGRWQPGGWLAEADWAIPAVEFSDLLRAWPAAWAPGVRAEVGRIAPQGRIQDAAGQFVFRPAAEGVRLVSAELRLPFRGVRLAIGQGSVLAEGLLRVAGEHDAWRLEEGVLRLASPRPGVAPSTISATGVVLRHPAAWQAALELGVDQIGFADLGAFWPPEIGGGARWWLSTNVTAGSIRDGSWRIEANLPDGQPARVVSLTGRARAQDATVQWLAPIPPVLGVSGEARFSGEAVVLETEGGRQARADGTPGGVELGPGTLRFLDLNQAVQRAELAFQLGGSLPDLLTVLRHPRLRLFERRPLELSLAEGRHTSQVTFAFPLLNDIPNDALRVRAEGRLSGLRMTRALLGRDLENGAAELVVDQDRLRVQGTANYLGAPLRLLTEMDFRSGPANGIVTRESVQGTATVAQLAQIGFDLGDVLGGSVAIDGRTERRRNGQATVTLRGDLAPASINLAAARWGKRVGSPGTAEATLRLQGDNLLGVDNMRVDVLDLSLRGRAVVSRGRIERYELAESLFGASRFQGDVRPPAQPGAPWQVSLRGPLLDLRPILAEARPEEAQAAGDTSPPIVMEARFDRITLGDRRELLGVQGRAVVDERGVMRQGSLRGRTGAAGGGFELTVAPRTTGRTLRITAEDGGAVLRALDGITTIEGGRLTLNGAWAGNEPGAALTGTAELDGFVVRGAPAIGKVLQAMTLYGLVEALQGGPGLSFARAEIPFTLTREALVLNNARAFSASLGLTARGRILREADILDIEGTIVPAYIFNSLLGNLPVLGRLFSPEPGGGVFATAFRAQGPAADPQVQVNPLSTLTPGFLRGLFGLGQSGDQLPTRR